MFYKKTCFKNFAIFTARTGKHLSRSPFLIQNIAKLWRAPILKNICEELLLKMCSWNWEIKIKNYFWVLTLHEKTGFFNISIRKKWECLLSHDWFPMFIFTYNVSLVWWEINSKNYISRINQKKMKSSRKYVMWTCFKFWPMKNIFRKL